MRYRSLLLAIAIMCATLAHAQRKAELRTQEEVDSRVSEALATDKSTGDLADLVKEFNLHGSFTFDLTVNEKGRTETVFPVGGTLENIADRNRVKQYLITLRFDFKLPKGTRMKTHQTLDFP